MTYHIRLRLAELLTEAAATICTAHVLRRVVRLDPMLHRGYVPYEGFSADIISAITHDILDHIAHDDAPAGTPENELMAQGAGFMLRGTTSQNQLKNIVTISRSWFLDKTMTPPSPRLRKLAALGFKDHDLQEFADRIETQLRESDELDVDSVLTYVAAGFQLATQAYKMATGKGARVADLLTKEADKFIKELAAKGLGHPVDVGVVVDTQRMTVEFTDKIDQRFFTQKNKH